MAVKKQKNKLNPLFIRIAIAIIGIAFIILIFVPGPRGTWNLYQSGRDKQILEQEINNLELKKAELDSERTLLLNDPEYIEKVAREKYNMKKEGEKVYKIEDDTDN